MNIGTERGTESNCPLLFNDSGKVSISCNLVVILENAKINLKIYVSDDFRISKFHLGSWSALLYPPY